MQEITIRGLLPRWILANAFGFSIGFLAMLQISNVIEFRQISWVEGVSEGIDAYIARLVSAIVGGLILGYAQSRVLKDYSVPTASWVLATASGFGAMIIAVEWPLL